MTKKERSLTEQLLANKQRQFQNYQQNIQQKSQQEDVQMTQQVLSEVNSFIEAYGEKHGYSLILGANNSGNIVYAETYLDITEELEMALNNNYKGI